MLTYADIKKWGLARLSDVAGASGVWGGITGTLSDQTDLQSALTAKADAITSQTLASGAISLGTAHRGKLNICSTGGNAFTVDTTGLSVGDCIELYNPAGGGTVTLASGSGTLVGTDGSGSMRIAPGGFCVLQATGTNTLSVMDRRYFYVGPWANRINGASAVDIAFITDIAGGSEWRWHSGTSAWWPLSQITICSVLGNDVAATLQTAAQIVTSASILLPAGVCKAGQRIDSYVTFTKSGTTDTMTSAIKIGTSGTTGDATAHGATTTAAGSRQNSVGGRVRFRDATTWQVEAIAGVAVSFAAPTGTITSGAAVWFDAYTSQSGITDTVSVSQMHVVLQPRGQ